MNKYKKCHIQETATWSDDRHWPRWDGPPDGGWKTAQEENKETQQQEEAPTVRFSGAHQTIQQAREMAHFPWWLQENADFTQFAIEWVTRVVRLRKYVREWKNVSNYTDVVELTLS